MKVRTGGRTIEIADGLVRGAINMRCEQVQPSSGKAMPTTEKRDTPAPQSPSMSICFTIPMQLQSGKNRVLITRTGHRYPPKRFQAWRDDVMRCLPPIAGPYVGPLHLIVDYVPGDRRKRDVPGMLDALLHVLERGKCMLDDAQVKQVTWTPFPIDRQHPRCTVTLSPIARNLDEEE